MESKNDFKVKKNKWYLSTFFISLLFAAWILVIPIIIGFVLLFIRLKHDKSNMQEQQQFIDSIVTELDNMKSNFIPAKEEVLQTINEKIDNANEELSNLNKKIDILRQNIESEISNKANILIEVDSLKQERGSLHISIEKIKDELKKSEVTINQNKKVVENAKKLVEERDKITTELKQKREDLIILDDELLLQSFGFFDPKFNLESSAKYKLKLEEIRSKQKEMVKSNVATDHFDGWTLDGSKQKGQCMNNDNIKLTLRSFNNECDTIISKVKFNNVEAYEKRINAAYKALNKANVRNKIVIKKSYLELKIDELYLAYEYENKKEEEKEEQREIREQMREEAKAKAELQKAREVVEKEEAHFLKELGALNEKLETLQGEARQAYEDKIIELETKLKEIVGIKDDIENKEKNTRAGYVYIISNIGSFGENVYKIGMTKRLEPMDRVKELGDASVPFIFDVHAMIFSEDAPNLENALHTHFNNRRLNLINQRKEFFNVSLEEIEKVVKENHNATVEFTKLAEASDFR